MGNVHEFTRTHLEKIITNLIKNSFSWVVRRKDSRVEKHIINRTRAENFSAMIQVWRYGTIIPSLKFCID